MFLPTKKLDTSKRILSFSDGPRHEVSVSWVAGEIILHQRPNSRRFRGVATHFHIMKMSLIVEVCFSSNGVQNMSFENPVKFGSEENREKGDGRIGIQQCICYKKIS